METGDKVEVTFGTHPHLMKVLVNGVNFPRLRGIKLETHISGNFTTLTLEAVKLPFAEPLNTETYSGVFVSFEEWEKFRHWQIYGGDQ